MFRMVIAALVCSVFYGCSAGTNKTNVELIQDMMDQISVKAQDWDPKTPDMSTVRVPPENTVPQGTTPYPYKGNPLLAETKLVNPLAGDFTPSTLSLGKERYQIYCKVCHGEKGMGDGPVAEKMAVRPPSLLSDKVRGFADGRIFHIITDGQGVMSSYVAEIKDSSPERRVTWAIVNYIRTLQKK